MFLPQYKKPHFKKYLPDYRIPQVGVGTCVFAVFRSLLKGVWKHFKSILKALKAFFDKAGCSRVFFSTTGWAFVVFYRIFYILSHTSSCCNPWPHYHIPHFFLLHPPLKKVDKQSSPNRYDIDTRTYIWTFRSVGCTNL